MVRSLRVRKCEGKTTHNEREYGEVGACRRTILGAPSPPSSPALKASCCSRPFHQLFLFIYTKKKNLIKNMSRRCGRTLHRRRCLTPSGIRETNTETAVGTTTACSKGLASTGWPYQGPVRMREDWASRTLLKRTSDNNRFENQLGSF